MAITSSHVQSITTSKRALAQEAEAIMCRARTILASTGRSHTDQIRDAGDLDVELVLHVFAVKPIENQTMAGISKKFLAKILGQADSQEEAKAAESSGHTPSPSNIVQFDSSGQAMGPGRATLLSQGFFVGAVVTIGGAGRRNK